MKHISIAVLILLLASLATAGCICCPTEPAVAPTTPIAHIVQPTTVPTVTVAPATSHIYMPEQTTNGRTYPTTPVYQHTVTNGSKPGGLAAGELGRQ